MSNTMWWYVMRSAGLTAWFFLTLTLVWGTLASGRMVPGARAKRWVVDMHPYLGSIGLGALALHILAAMSDSYVGLRWVNAVVPFTAGWRPWGVAFGVVSVWLLVVVEGTSLVRRRLSKTTWHRIHLASYVGAWLTGVHAVMSGTDLGNPVVAWTAFALLVAATAIVAVRALRSGSRPTPNRVSTPGTRAGRKPGTVRTGEPEPVRV
jgi:methionine sulfoxide reductase heme-binding subunit